MAKYNRHYLHTIGIKTTAKVVGYAMKNDGEDDMYYPIIAFEEGKGEKITHTLKISQTFKMFEKKMEVPIMYDPNDLDNFIVLETDEGVIRGYLFIIAVIIIFIYLTCNK